MGCGSSSLKGDAPNLDSDAAPRPSRKAATNFNIPDYDTSAKNRRMTEYAPHETEGQASTRPDSNASDARPGDSGPGAGVKNDGENLKPYQTLNGDGTRDEVTDQSYPHEQVGAGHGQVNGDTAGLAGGAGAGADPTSSAAKDQFASANDPANPANQEHHHSSSSQQQDSLGPRGQEGEAGNERKRSWLGQKYKDYTDARDGRNTELSDEELKKYTGMDSDGIAKLKDSGAPGVGGAQSASMRDPAGPGTGVSGLVSYTT